MPGIDPKRAIRTAWSILDGIVDLMEKAGAPSLLDGNKPDSKKVADPIRALLKRMLRMWKRDYTGPAAAVVIIEFLLMWPDVSLANINCRVPPDTISEFLNVPVDEALDTPMSAPEASRAIELGEKMMARIKARNPKIDAARDEYAKAHAGFEDLLKAARSHLPDTGETHDLNCFIEVARFYLVDVSDTESIPITPALGRIVTRFAVWNVLGEIAWGADARKVLMEFVAHPGRFARFEPKTPEARSAKQHLRGLSDAFIGFHPPQEEGALLAVLGRPDATNEDLLWATSQYLFSRSDKFGPNALHKQFMSAFCEIAARDICNLLQLTLNVREYKGDIRLRTSVDAEVEDLIRQDPSLAAPLDVRPETPSCPPTFQPDVSAPVLPVAAPKLFHFKYVINPESEFPQIATLSADEDNAYEIIQTLFEEHCEAPEPIESLSRAVYHHVFETPSEHLLTWKKEAIGHFVFHKLKRGRARIYVRIEDDTVLFHAYARRDWQKPFSFPFD